MHGPVNVIQAVALLLFAALFAGLGWKVEHWRGGVALAQCQRDAATALATHNAEWVAAVQRDRAAADAAVAAAQTRTETAETLARSYRDEIERLTTGRDCLRPDAVSLLQLAPAFAAPVPGAAGVALGPAPTTAPDPGDRYTTDTDIALWIADAAFFYERCRARVDGLRAWANANTEQSDGR